METCVRSYGIWRFLWFFHIAHKPSKLPMHMPIGFLMAFCNAELDYESTSHSMCYIVLGDDARSLASPAYECIAILKRVCCFSTEEKAVG